MHRSGGPDPIQSASKTRLRVILREPLLHFLLVGVVLFAVDRWRAEKEPTPTAPAGARRIVVDDQLREEIRGGLARQRRPPTPAELDAAVARWVEEEVLYREALARGLDRDDPAVRLRVVGKMATILEQAVVLPAPSEAELRAWFDRHRDAFGHPERIDFTHVFVAGEGEGAETAAVELLRQLESGEDPDVLGDSFSGGRRYRGRKLADLTTSFGPEFTDRLDRQVVGSWQRRRSRHGLHLVRVDARIPARPADFAAARLDVQKEWEDERRAEALAGEIRALRARWQVVDR